MTVYQAKRSTLSRGKSESHNIMMCVWYGIIPYLVLTVGLYDTNFLHWTSIHAQAPPPWQVCPQCRQPPQSQCTGWVWHRCWCQPALTTKMNRGSGHSTRKMNFPLLVCTPTAQWLILYPPDWIWRCRTANIKKQSGTTRAWWKNKSFPFIYFDGMIYSFKY
jgi:hypothetical protein